MIPYYSLTEVLNFIMDVKFEYEKIYAVHSFERLGLFECLKSTFEINTVAYIGSSIHITPSFVFQNVTYIDKSDLTKCFFKEKNELVSYINTRKQYKLKPYIHFIDDDYNQGELFSRSEYDLVLAINSPNSLNAALKIVKSKGLLLYLPLPQEASLLTSQAKIKSIGFIHKKGKKYIFEKDEINQRLKKNYNKNLVFVENNEYHVYEKVI